MNRKPSLEPGRLVFVFFACMVLVAQGPVSRLAVQGQTADPRPHTEDPFKVERKDKAPVSAERVPAKSNRFSEFKLDNGLTVVIREDRRLPIVFVQLQIAGAGQIYEPPSQPGLAGFTSQLLWAGTKTRIGYQITEEANKLGASLGYVTNFGSSVTMLNATGLSGNFNEWFAILTDVLLNPAFPPDAVSWQRERLAESLRAPPLAQEVATRQLKRALFGSHPAGVSSASGESVDTFTPAALADWHRERYAPQNAILGITGDVNTSELLTRIKKSFAEWRRNDFTRTLPPNRAPATFKTIMFVDSEDSSNNAAIIMAGDIAIERRSPDFFALTVLNQVIGGDYSSRLYNKLRDSLYNMAGFGPTPTPNAFSRLNAMEYRGEWFAYSLLRADAMQNALPTFLAEISRIRDEKIPELELEDVKRKLAVSYVLALEDPATILNNEITRRFYSLPEDYWDAYPANIMAVTSDDVQRVAQKYVNPATIQIVAAGSGAKVREPLQKLGPVEIYGTRNSLKGCAPASPAGADDFKSTVSQFISFKNARATKPDSEKWNPAGCLPGAIECSIGEGSLSSCSMYHSANLEGTEKFYRALVEKVGGVLPENWKAQEKGPVRRILKEFVARLEGATSSVTISLRENTIDEGEDPSGKYTVALRFSAR